MSADGLEDKYVRTELGASQSRDVPEHTSTAQESNHRRGATLELRSLTKRFGEVEALIDVSLTVNRGEFLALLGPSGAGKTTALRLIAGFEQPDVGDILVDGRRVTNHPAHRRNIGVVFQHYALFPHMTVEENVAFPLKMRKISGTEIAKRVTSSLALVSLAGLQNRMPSQLSGGQKQRVALARSIVFEPDLLLMDEPLAALDKKLRDGLRVELKRLQDELGATVVYVTHDQDEALSMADRVAVMHSGRIEQLGPPEAVYHRPDSYFVAQFVGEGNFFECRVVHADFSSALLQPKDVEGEIRVFFSDRNAIKCSPGDAVTYMIRPECVAIAESEDYLHKSESAPNRLPARVIEKLFFGSRTTYILASGEHRITVSVSAGDDVGIDKDEECMLVWGADEGSLLEAH